MTTLPYSAPGVTVTELITPSISPVLDAPATPCIIGLGVGVVRVTDLVTFADTSSQFPVALPTATLVGGPTLSSTAIVSVTDANDPSVTASAGYVVGSGGDLTKDEVAKTVTRTSTSAIPRTGSVYITYDYLPPNYFTPQKYTELASIEQNYGSAYNAAGTAINSVLSYAARCAFEGGAGELYVAPLFVLTSGSDPTSVRLQPTSTQAAAASTWAQTLFALRDFDDVNILVPAVGQSAASVDDAAELAILQTVQDHIQFMQASVQYMVAICGEDSSTSTSGAPRAQDATLITHASTLRARYGGAMAQDMVLLNVGSVKRALPGSGSTINVGAQYVAASISGMISTQNVTQTLNGITVPGFTAVNDARSRAQKKADGQGGLTVIDDRRGSVAVRHAITLDNQSNTANRELSVVRAKHRMIETVRNTLEANVIGKVAPNGNPSDFVITAVQGALESLKVAGEIVDYTNIQARTVTNDPTTVEVRFSYKPAFPVNYVNISFSLDLSTPDSTEVTA